MEEDVARVDVPILSVEAEALRGVMVSLVFVQVLDEHIEDPT